MSAFQIDLLTFFGRASLLLDGLVTVGIIKSSTGTQIAGVIEDLRNVTNGVSDPSADLATSVLQLLKDLDADGVISLADPNVEAVANGLGNIASFVADVKGNQVAIIKTADLFGVPGSYAFVPNNSEQGVSLGLGAEAPSTDTSGDAAANADAEAEAKTIADDEAKAAAAQKLADEAEAQVEAANAAKAQETADAEAASAKADAGETAEPATEVEGEKPDDGVAEEAPETAAEAAPGGDAEPPEQAS